MAALKSELATMRAYLREVSRVTMADRLEVIVRISDSGEIALEGRGFDGRDLGGTNIKGEDFVQRLKSISEEYAQPRITFAADKNSPAYPENRTLVQQLCGRAGIYTISVSDPEEPIE